MAPRKSAGKKKSSRAMKPKQEMAPLAVSEPISQNKNKGIIRILIAIVLVVCVAESLNLSHGGDVPKPYKVQTLLNISSDSNACGHFNAWGVAPIGKDKIMVVDQEAGRLLVFDRKGNCVKSWGKTGDGPKEFHEPSGATWDDHGNAYVIDTWNSAIKGFDENGKQVADIVLSNENFYGPRGIGFDGRNFVLADTGSHRVAFVSMDGKLVGSWGTAGTGSGQFKGPLDVSADGKGNYLVADTENQRAQWLDQDGKVLKIIKFNNPNGKSPAATFDKSGRFFISTSDSAGNSCVKVYSAKDGSYIGDLVDEKNEEVPGGRGMNVSSDGVLMVADGVRVSLYQIPAATP